MKLNLITDSWIKYVYQDGTSKSGAISELVDPEIVDVLCPRADFYGALHQFLVSVVQTIAAPEDFNEWEDYYFEPFSLEEFEQKLTFITHAFDVYGDGARFMQDLDPLNDVKDATPISALLIEAPGAKTIKQNTDHFIKRGITNELSPEMAALALYTLQINGPAGGQGHRTGIRGGGPLTTLVRPSDNNSALWQKIWLNVRDRENWSYPEPNFQDGSVFPWLAATKISKKPNTELYSSEVHPLHVLWPTPRRIRLNIDDEEGICSLTGEKTKAVVRCYKMQNYGHNYVGKWIHPLSPYRQDPKKPLEAPYATKAQPGGITYQHWLTLLFSGREDDGSTPAEVVKDYSYERIKVFDTPARVWTFGYDMKSQQARGWYSVEMPMLYSDANIRKQQVEVIEHMLSLSQETMKYCRNLIKAVFTNRPKDFKGDLSFIDANFYQSTANDFFSIVAKSTKESTDKVYTLTEADARQWQNAVANSAITLFDFYTISGIDFGQPKNMQRIVTQRKLLQDWLRGAKNKPLKLFKQLYLTSFKETAK